MYDMDYLSCLVAMWWNDHHSQNPPHLVLSRLYENRFVRRACDNRNPKPPWLMERKEGAGRRPFPGSRHACNDSQYEEHTNTYALDRAMAEILWVEAKKKAPPFGGASMSWDIQAAKVRLHSGTALPPTC